MMRVAVACLIVMMIALPARAADDTGAMLDKALDELVKNGYQGDNSSAVRYLQAILEQHPDHLEASWQILYTQMAPLMNARLIDRASALAAITPEINRLVALAKKTRQTGFAHFMTALHAGYYKDYDRALREIDQAVSLEPRSARFLTWKGRLHLDHGEWMENDAEIGNGVAILKAARDLAKANPSHFLRDENFEFSMAEGLTHLRQPPWQEVADHYERFIEKSEPSTLQAFALNNVSNAYVKLGQCDKAKTAAEKALAYMKFGAATLNKRYAEFCLEIAKSDLTTK